MNSRNNASLEKGEVEDDQLCILFSLSISVLIIGQHLFRVSVAESHCRDLSLCHVKNQCSHPLWRSLYGA